MISKIFEHKVDRATLVLGLLTLVPGIVMAVIFRDSMAPTLHYTINVLVALGAGFIGAFIPGAIGVEGNFQGMMIRAAGGLAVFVLVFLGFFFLKTAPTIEQVRQSRAALNQSAPADVRP